MTTNSRSNPTIALNERPFTVRFSKYDSIDRDELEQFISDISQQTYGVPSARSDSYLMSLRDHEDELIAVCGLHSAATDKLSLEIHLDQPIEAVLSGLAGVSVKRGDIVEISRFSVAELGMSRYLITAINDQLHFTSKQWAVLTATPALRDAFINFGMNPLVLAQANLQRLPEASQTDWGNFFDQKPQIIAIKRMERRNKSRNP